METSKRTMSNFNTSVVQEVNEQIYFLRKLEQYQELNISLQTKIKIMEEQLSKKNASRPVEADLYQVLTQLSKKNSKLETQLAKTVHKQNQALAQIKVRKEAIKLARNERVIHSGIFKNIQKQIKIKEDVYKNLLINKKLDQISKSKIQDQYHRKIKFCHLKLKQVEKSIEDAKVKKDLLRKTMQKQKQSYIIRNSIIAPTKIPQFVLPKQSNISTHRNVNDQVLYDYSSVQLQQQKLLKLTNKQTLEEVADLMQTLDNQKLLEKIQQLSQKIQQGQDQLKQYSNLKQKYSERVNQQDQFEEISQANKRLIIAKTNKQKGSIEEMIKRAYQLAAKYKIQTQQMSDLDVFVAIQSLLPRQAAQNFCNTDRSNESSGKLTNLLMKSKRSKQNEELMSSTRFKELYSNLHNQ